MSICPHIGSACHCQPQEGIMCPYGPTPNDWQETQMTNEKSLVQRLREHAVLHADLAQHSEESAQWARDLYEAADLLAQRTVPEPLAKPAAGYEKCLHSMADAIGVAESQWSIDGFCAACAWHASRQNRPAAPKSECCCEVHPWCPVHSRALNREAE